MAAQISTVTLHLGSTELSDPDIQTFIDKAKRYYEEELGTEYSVSQELKDDVIEYLAAHFIASGPERQISSAGEGGGRVSFEGRTTMGLQMTTHGQNAIMHDPTGVLARASAPQIDFDVVDISDDDPST